MIISFHAIITLPDTGHFHMKEACLENPQKFLKEWIEASISNIYTQDLHTGKLTVNRPKVEVRVNG